MSKNTLHLTLKSKWYDMIASGEKKEVYREIKPYWRNRFVAYCTPWLCTDKVIWHIGANFTSVCFHRGFTNTTMTYECAPIRVGKGNTEWGAPKDKDVFIITLWMRIK